MLSAATRRVIRFLSSRADQGGQALLFAVIAIALLASIPIAITTETVNQLPQTTRNLSWDDAYEAAQAGLNDYLQHLDADSSYGNEYNSGNCTSSASPCGNPAFYQWVSLSSSPPEYYAYSPTVTQSGLISLDVSGKAGTGRTAVVRTFSYMVRPASSLNDVYWSNYESLDPVVAATEPGGPNDCGAVYYGQGGGPASDCVVSFATGDELNGPVFTNDTYHYCGSPKFDSTLESGNIYSNLIIVQTSGNGCNGNPSYAVTPTQVSNQTPQSSEVDLGPARNYGCFIAGTSGGNPTMTTTTMTLSVSGSGATATTKVAWSGGTVQNASTNHNSCTSPITLSTLSSGLIFVDGNVNISGAMTGGLDVVSCSGTGSGYAGCNSTTPSNITITGSLTYPSANITNVGTSPVNGTPEPYSDTTDTLGLIAQNSVIVGLNIHPNITIDAAILALKDSFYVSGWYNTTPNNLGYLNVFGSIAQNFRGPVGLVGGASGYSKNYSYDTSLGQEWPPYFIPPTGAVWAPTSYEECSPGNNDSVLNNENC
ncbi:MAG TPA: hypothetical protein VIJ09_02485 [Acidimicrobiales bacterium]|jgi:hypothetical protein